MADDKKFVKGVMVFNPHQNAPDFVLTQVVITPKEFIEWLTADAGASLVDGKYGKQLKLTVKKSKDGKHYAEIDTYQPTKTAAATPQTPVVPPQKMPWE